MLESVKEAEEEEEEERKSGVLGSLYSTNGILNYYNVVCKAWPQSVSLFCVQESEIMRAQLLLRSGN
jgi:hypothetical protein